MPPKITRKKTILPPPKKAPPPTGKTLAQGLAEIDLGEGKHLTPDQINKLLALQFPDGTKILTKDRVLLLFDVIDMLRRLSFEDVYTYLQSSANPKDVVLSSPLFENERDRVQLELDNLQKKIIAEKGIYQCSECHGWETLSTHKQVRSADEPMSTFVRCLGCNKNWRID